MIGGIVPLAWAAWHWRATNYGALAGSASSLYTTLLFGAGAVFGAVSGMYFDSTLKPMAVTMFAASVLANALAFTTGAKFRKEPAALD